MQGITLWLQIRLQFEMKYKKWKGTDRIKEAEKIAEKLKFDLEKNPTKKDFVNAGLYIFICFDYFLLGNAFSYL